jgi:hypothetical protein
MIDGTVSEGSVSSEVSELVPVTSVGVVFVHDARLKSMEHARTALTILFFIISLPGGFYT